MSFLRLEEDRCVNTDQIADLQYSPAGSVQIVSPGSDEAPPIPATLSITLSNGEAFSVSGEKADGLWDAFQSVLQQPPAQPDWFLQMLVNMANTSDIRMDITLQLNGFLVSGQLVGGAVYFDAIGEGFAKALGDAAGLKETFAALRDRHYPKNEDEATPKPGPTFVHMKDARFYNNGGLPIPSNGGVWWRGRLSEVSGFTLGSLSPNT